MVMKVTAMRHMLAQSPSSLMACRPKAKRWTRNMMVAWVMPTMAAGR